MKKLNLEKNDFSGDHFIFIRDFISNNIGL